MTSGQRVVVTVASGVASMMAAHLLSNLIYLEMSVGDGWFTADSSGYDSTSGRMRTGIAIAGVVHLGAVGGWAALAWRLWRPPQQLPNAEGWTTAPSPRRSLLTPPRQRATAAPEADELGPRLATDRWAGPHQA